MIHVTSRYQDAEMIFAPSHTYSEDGDTILNDQGDPKVDYRSTLYRVTTAEDEVGPSVYMVKTTDTMWGLAATVLQDPGLWWKVADVNPEVRYPLDLETGNIIRIPE